MVGQYFKKIASHLLIYPGTATIHYCISLIGGSDSSSLGPQQQDGSTLCNWSKHHWPGMEGTHHPGAATRAHRWDKNFMRETSRWNSLNIVVYFPFLPYFLPQCLMKIEKMIWTILKFLCLDSDTKWAGLLEWCYTSTSNNPSVPTNEASLLSCYFLGLSVILFFYIFCLFCLVIYIHNLVMYRNLNVWFPFLKIILI